MSVTSSQNRSVYEFIIIINTKAWTPRGEKRGSVGGFHVALVAASCSLCRAVGGGCVSLPSDCALSEWCMKDVFHE